MTDLHSFPYDTVEKLVVRLSIRLTDMECPDLYSVNLFARARSRLPSHPAKRQLEQIWREVRVRREWAISEEHKRHLHFHMLWNVYFEHEYLQRQEDKRTPFVSKRNGAGGSALIQRTEQGCLHTEQEEERPDP